MQINSLNGVSFGSKLATEDVVKVVSGHCWPVGGYKACVDVCSEMTGWDDIGFLGAVGVSPQCMDSLKQQYPILKDVQNDAVKFFKSSKKTPVEMQTWVDNQVKKIGSDRLDVKPVRLDIVA